jgi:ATP-binding cassette subfamily B protein
MLARAAVRDAPFLLLDEPLEGLDPISRLEVAQGIMRLTAGRTTIAISHGRPEELSPDHTILLHEGHVVLDGEREVTPQ